MDLKRFDKKHISDVDLKTLNLNVPRLHPEVFITRTKDDPGAIHIMIKTKGGVAAILRYAYADKALTRDVKQGYSAYRFNTKYNTAYMIIGNRHGDLDDKKNDLLDMIFDIVSTNHEVPNAYDRDGFIRLVRRYNRQNIAKKFGDSPKEAFYRAEINIHCFGIRDEKDEPVVALVNALTMWGNKVDVQYSDYEMFSRYCNNKVQNTIMRNHGTIDAMDEMTEYGISDNVADTFIITVADMFEHLDDMPEYVSGRKNLRVNYPPSDGYYYDPDFDY